MCLEGVFGYFDQCFMAVIGCVCCLLIGGPALIIGGVLLLKEDDTKPSDQFNKAVKDFDPTPIYAWTGNINGVPVTVKRESLNVRGESGAASVFAEVVVPAPKAPSSTLPVDVRINTVTPFVRNVAFEVKKTSSYRCDSFWSDKRKSEACGDGLRAFRQQCAASLGNFVSTSALCVSGTTCGKCEVKNYLKEMLLAVREVSVGKYEATTFGWTDGSGVGDFNKYQRTRPDNITVRVRSGTDPFFAVDYDAQPDRSITGIVLIVIGCLFFLLGCCVCAFLMWSSILRRLNASSQQPPFASSQGQTMGCGNVTGNPYGQQPPQTEMNTAYGQSPPGVSYGQPPPPAQGYPYGQPPPLPQGYSYGQPPPPAQGYPYGQPPPLPQGYSYGQPPPPAQGYSYEQPPPLYGYGQQRGDGEKDTTSGSK